MLLLLLLPGPCSWAAWCAARCGCLSPTPTFTHPHPPTCIRVHHQDQGGGGAAEERGRAGRCGEGQGAWQLRCACWLAAVRLRAAAAASRRAAAPPAPTHLSSPTPPAPHPAPATAPPQASKNLRRGKGKMRNRRYVQRKGPLVIYGNDAGIRCAFWGVLLAAGSWPGWQAGPRWWCVHVCVQERLAWQSASCALCLPACQAAACSPAPPPCRRAPAPARRSRAFRNLPGCEVACVDRLNLLQLAPGGHLGRFCIWTKSAVEKLDKIFGER